MLGSHNDNHAARLLLLVLALSLALARAAGADTHTRYVIDVVVVTVRAEASDSAEVLSRVSTGDRVQLTGLAEGTFEQVRLEDGTLGWVDSRFISSDEPATLGRQRLRAEFEELQQLYDRSREAQAESEDALIRLSDDYRLVNEELTKLRGSAGDPSDIELKLEQMKEQLAMVEAESEQLLRLNKELKESSDTRWFLVGAGVLLAGIVLGMAIPRVRKRRTSWDHF